MSSQSIGDERFRLRPATFSSPPSSPSPSASRCPSLTTSPPPSPHTHIAPRLTPADAVFQYSSRPLIPITTPVTQVDYSGSSSPAASPVLLSTDTHTNAHASAAFQYSSRPLEPICIPVLAPVKAEAGPSVSEGPASPSLAGSGAPPQASPPRLSRQAKGKWRETENSPPRTADPAQHPPQSYSPNEQASGDNAAQNEGVENNNGDDKGNLKGEDQAEGVDSLPGHRITRPTPSNQGQLIPSTASIAIAIPPIPNSNDSPKAASTGAGGDIHERADAPFAHLPPALRPTHQAAARPLNKPSPSPKTSNALRSTRSSPKSHPPCGPTAHSAQDAPATPQRIHSPSPSPPRSPTPATNSNHTPSSSQAPIHGEGGDEAKSSAGKGLLTLVSLTMWPVRNGAKPRTGVVTRSQVLKAKGGVLPAAAAQLVTAQGGRDAGKDAGPRDSGTKRKRTASVSATAAGTANKNKNGNKKAQGTAKRALGSTKAERTEREDKAEDDANVDGKTETRGDVAEALTAAESPRPAKRARLTAPHGGAKAAAKAMIRLPPRVTRASARVQATTGPSTSKAELDENESGVGGDNGEFQFIV
ncbi:hypothetical protein EYR38_009178 [Pleurotus pulmonarius]|nr:hypothetical protein EYR38_009178 [Pleurotus pulmonarius]